MFLVVNPPQISRFELIRMNVVPKSSRKNASKLPKLNYIIDNGYDVCHRVRTNHAEIHSRGEQQLKPEKRRLNFNEERKRNIKNKLLLWQEKVFVMKLNRVEAK